MNRMRCSHKICLTLLLAVISIPIVSVHDQGFHRQKHGVFVPRSTAAPSVSKATSNTSVSGFPPESGGHTLPFAAGLRSVHHFVLPEYCSHMSPSCRVVSRETSGPVDAIPLTRA